MRIVLLGSPGAGKGTQAQFIQAKFQIPQVSTGDMLRTAIHTGTSLGNKVKKTLEEGGLVADNVMIELVRERIQQPDCKNGFLLDGFPRTIPQAEALRENDIRIDYVIEIRVPDEELIKRLTGRWVHPPSNRIYHFQHNPPKKPGFDDITGEPLVQRTDDLEETVRKRLAIYHEQTKPLIDYYKTLKKNTSHEIPVYIEVNGLGSVEEIKERIFAALCCNSY